MFKDISIKGKILLLSLITIVIVSVAIAVDSIYSIKNFSNKNIENFKNEAYAKKELELKNYVSLAVKTVEAYHNRTSIDKIKVEVQDQLKMQTNFLFSILESEYEKLKGTMSDEALKQRLKSIVDATRYGNTGYFWINDTNSVIVTHPIKPELNGKDMVEYKDKGGKQIFKEFSIVAKNNGEGFVDYVWPKPGFEAPQLKVSFVKLFKPYNWVVGTGEYVDDVTSKMQAEALKTIGEMRYANNDYFWINDSSPKMIMHPVSKHLDGKDLSGNADAKGKKLFIEMSKVANGNKAGGLVKYWWDKPEKKNDPKEKFSYVQKFEPWDWIIGTGAYVDDIENEVALMEKNINEEISSKEFVALPSVENCKFCLNRPACQHYQSALLNGLVTNDITGKISKVQKFLNGNVSLFLETQIGNVIIKNFDTSFFDSFQNAISKKVTVYNVRSDRMDNSFLSSNMTRIYEQ